MITIDLTMLIQIANILIMIWIMNAVLYKPIRTILEERGKRIAGLEKDVENFTENGRLRLEAFDKKLNDARAKAKAELDTARGEAQTAGAAQLAEIRKKADAEKAVSLKRVEEEIGKARSELQGQVAAFATEMAGKILGRAI
ncbi:MAG: ATP synthase F0 subunit B [Proteobacteria bacterium]|nr:ATP synthase F0 subunit B [Pseudomonadota bacterium]MBU1738827.1 ATP synthase F0 subunit B [Pseudomonadota bacterium]